MLVILGCNHYYLGYAMNKLKELLILHEGARQRMYKCSAGYNTIGIGHNLDAKPISDKAIDQIFNDDLDDVLNEVDNLPYWDELSDVRQAVLIDMCFNLGYEGLLKFRKMHTALSLGDFEDAAVEMIDSKWARQVGIRADRLRAMMETDTWP